MSDLIDRTLAAADRLVTGSTNPAETQMKLSGVTARLNQVVTDYELAYKKKLVELRKDCKSAADAKLFGEATDEYAEWRRHLAAKDSCEHMLKALSNASYSANAESRLTR